MDHFPLVEEQIAAGREFAERLSAAYPVSVAFWYVPADASDWKLGVASDEITSQNDREAYRQIRVILAGGLGDYLDPLQIRLLNSEEPVAAGAIALRDTSPAKLPVRSRNSLLGNTPVEEVYIYPIAQTAAVPA